MKPTAQYLRERLTRTVEITVDGEPLEFVIRKLDNHDMFHAFGRLVLVPDGAQLRPKTQTEISDEDARRVEVRVIVAALVEPVLSADDVALIPLAARVALASQVMEFSGLSRPFDGSNTDPTLSSSTGSPGDTAADQATSCETTCTG